jgi:hypothetical protein
MHQWWFLTSGVVACSGVALLQDSSVAHRCVCAGLTHLTLRKDALKAPDLEEWKEPATSK